MLISLRSLLRRHQRRRRMPLASPTVPTPQCGSIRATVWRVRGRLWPVGRHSPPPTSKGPGKESVRQ